jgi:hypothetical protein
VVSVALAGLVVPVASVVLAALAGLVVSAASVVLAAGMALQPFRPVAEVPTGNTTRNIAAGPRMETEEPRTGLGARRVAIPLATVSPTPGNRLAAKAAIYPVIVVEERAPVVQALATGRVEAEGTALEIDKFQIPAAARRTGAPLVEHLPARVAAQHDPAVRAVRPAWEAPVAEVPAAAAVGAVGAGGGRANYDH